MRSSPRAVRRTFCYAALRESANRQFNIGAVDFKAAVVERLALCAEWIGLQFGKPLPLGLSFGLFLRLSRVILAVQSIHLLAHYNSTALSSQPAPILSPSE